MNCEQCRIELEDFLYGELDEPQAAAVRAHLNDCAECRAARAGLERETAIFAAYYEQNAPEPDEAMWEAIRARLAREPHAPPQVAGLLERLSEWVSAGFLDSLLTPALMRQAAFAVLLVTLSVGLTAFYFKFRGGDAGQTARSSTPQPNVTVQPSATAQTNATERPVPQPSTPTRIEESPNPQVAAETSRRPATAAPAAKRSESRRLSESEVINAQVARAVREYEGAVKLLGRAVAKRKQELDPRAVAQFEDSLALIDQSIVASRRALREHPDDPTAARFLLAAYSKKVELMQEIAMR